MTNPDDKKYPDEDIELSKETIDDLDVPEEVAEVAKGGPKTNGWTGVWDNPAGCTA